MSTMEKLHLAKVVESSLSDGSVAYNVKLEVNPGCRVTFACETEQHAKTLADAINGCAWVC